MDWTPYYDFKGKQLMESKLVELQTAVNNNMLQEWLKKPTNSQEHENIHNYYYLNGLAPDRNGIYFDEALEMEKIEKAFETIPQLVPLLLWSYNDVIVDGTIIEIDLAVTVMGEHVPFYTIKVNDYFKGEKNAAIITGMDNFGEVDFQLFDNGLFYLKKLQNENKYSISPTSIQTFGNCDARDLIEIVPVLPNEDPPRSAPTRSESFFDPCIAEYFHYDPDFFKGVLNSISPLKQIKYGIPNELIRCYDDLTKVTKHNGTPACVTHETKQKLIERGYINDVE